MPVLLKHTPKQLVARSFGAAAESYDGVATLQRSVARMLLEKAGAPAGELQVLDVGAGTGYCSAALQERYPKARVLALDIAEGMLRRARGRFSGPCVVGDAEALPFATDSADLVFSNLAIQWCGCPAAAFGEFRRVLRPGGRLVFATFGPMTLTELRQAWAQADDRTHVNDFVGVSRLREGLASAGFVGIDVQSSPRRVAYADVMSLMRELKGLGARNLTARRPRHLLGKGALARMMAAYPRTTGGSAIEATFDIMTGTALCADGRGS